MSALHWIARLLARPLSGTALASLSPAARVLVAAATVAVIGGGAIAYEAFSPPTDASRPPIAPRPAPQRAVAESTPATGQTDAVRQHTGGQDCLVCHVSKHPERKPCTKCHEPGTTWSVPHPKATNCASCHDTPKAHYPLACGTCHTPGKAFSTARYDHKAAPRCQACHTPPHPARGACATCHRPGSWRPTAGAVDHRSGARCLSCHKAGHANRGSRCATCHRPGVSWASRHPSSSACSSCHKAPARHFGSACASCHRPSRSWSSATFKHPSIRGGEHTYRSFACANCHPSGYSSATCTKCHDGGTPDGD